MCSVFKDSSWLQDSDTAVCRLDLPADLPAADVVQ